MWGFSVFFASFALEFELSDFETAVNERTKLVEAFLNYKNSNNKKDERI